MRRVAALLFFVVLVFGCNTAKSANVQTAGAEGKTDRYAELVTAPSKGVLTLFFPDLDVSPLAQDKSGDAAILFLPDGKVAMVDSGHPESVAETLALLSDLGIVRIDYFFISHPHIDHIGGFPAIAGKYDIGEVFRTELEYRDSETYRLYITAVEKAGIPVRYLKRGDAFQLGDGLVVRVFNPPENFTYPANYPANSTQFINDNSLVMKLSWGQSSVLFGGDIYLTRERELIDLYGEELRALVTKANHHGSETSNSAGWIRTVQPRAVIAMDDQITSMTVYNNFRRNGTAYYHPFLDGLVRVSLDREGNFTVVTRYDSWLRD